MENETKKIIVDEDGREYHVCPERVDGECMSDVSVDCKCKAEPTRGWYESELKRLNIENEKLKKLVDILLERIML